ncbi:MAG: SDR family oxidoreductase [Clostridiales bacterium]|nr:SDR family oxidoreductase [Clostridiales bacterium]MDY5726761.1 SDR family oxidoreductase [Eubacteriales bacterium]
MFKTTVLITGASRGIGAECARTFAKNGYNVAINYFRSEKNALDLKAEINDGGGVAEIFKADVSDEKQVEEMISAVVKRFGKINVLVANAGVSKSGVFSDMTQSDFDKIFDTNVRGVFNVVKGVLPHMYERESGSIVTISSIWGQTGGSCEVLYSMSKAAIIGMTKALAKEVAPMHIRVNSVSPGAIDTDMLSGMTDEEKEDFIMQTPLNRLGEPKDVADAVLFLADDDKSSFITGHVLSVNGGYFI